ncbi:hypothetical protein [Aquimarina sediminis]|uniref:hypothetical protein n=1 Tax=Aquimarina sediminis TaxID=2070536 RepID=UPI000CA07EB9|nr:hypothetical protein [Aquimarina sediminis]
MKQTLEKSPEEMLTSNQNQFNQEKTRVLKEKVKVLFDSNIILKNRIKTYDAMVERLDILEKKEHEKNIKSEKKHNPTYLENKFRILRIISKYNEMSTLMGIYEEYNEVFLNSNESRRAMLIEGGCVFCKVNNELKIYPIDNYIEKQEELVDIVKSLMSSDDNIEHLHFWQGCEMAIPKNSKIILNFNKPYPSVYVKKRESEDEIFIEENSWHVNYIADKGFLRVIEDEHRDHFHGAVMEDEMLKIKTNKVSISKKEYANKLEENTNLQDDYQSINMKVLEALIDCDVVVQMPYITPSADMLVKVSFKGSDTEELILSTS